MPTATITAVTATFLFSSDLIKSTILIWPDLTKVRETVGNKHVTNERDISCIFKH